MWNKKGVVPKGIIKAYNQKWMIMPGVTETSTITMKEMEEKTFLKFTTRPHGAIEKDMERMLNFKPKTYYYERMEND